MARRAVVTGMGAFTPIGKNLEEFWTAIRNGVSGVAQITRFDASELPCQVAAEIKDYRGTDYFEHKLVQRTALFSQFGMIAAEEAWKHAGLDKFVFKNHNRVSVLIGSGIGGLEVDSESQHKMFQKGPNRIPAMTIPKMIANECAGNISMHLGIRGPAHTVVTACASGTDALGFALDSIRSGRTDVVLSGGAESTVTPFGIGGFCSLKALSTNNSIPVEKRSRPFDKDRDGFVMGEGSGILVIEELEHAKQRGAKIYGELAGFGATADAYHLTAPSPEGTEATQAVLFAIQDAGLKPEEIDYVNAHGTATPTNDPIETKVIKQALGEHAYKIKVSSTKGMTGHCLGAAGGIEAIVSVMSMYNGFYPATINLDEPDPECDLDYVPNIGQSGKINTVISTSFGFGGHNAVLAFKKYE